MESTGTSGAGPLSGLLVADFSRILAGPYASMLLADLGADVVKVEGPGGDDTRTWMPPVRDGESTYYLSINRNKRSVALDLKDEHDAGLARELASRADIVLENFRVGGLARFCGSLYARWDAQAFEARMRVFDIPLPSRFGTLSKGQKARAGLAVALAYRPELLVLDEPSSGLDPIVRRDILGAVIRTIADEGRTVLFSSHLLNEVEEVADHVTMIQHGRILMSAPLAEIKASHPGLSLDEIFVKQVAGV